MQRVARWRVRPWSLAFATAVAGVAVLRLVALDSIPPGLHYDEASVGYNAWTIAHHGVDEHGASFPLFFEAFGEYKNPLYIYLLAPMTWFLPLTPAVERLPALCGIGLCIAVAAAVHRATGSRPAAMAALLTAALTPWAVVDARVGFEAPVLPLCLGLAIWCYSRAVTPAARQRWLWATGTALGAAVFAYSSARLLVLLIAVGAALFVPGCRPSRRAAPLFAPMAAAYAALAAYAAGNPTAVFGRLGGISVASDEPGPLVVVARVVRNYLTQLDPQFLFTHGDANLRHNTGFGGMFLVASLPALAAGVAACIRRRGEPLPAFLLAGPVPAAVTNDAIPHALRAIGMLPFALTISGYGWDALLGLLRGRRMLLGLAVSAVALEAGAFLVDLTTRYADRAVTAFDTGEITAIRRARTLAHGHRVLLSTDLGKPYIEALFALQPPPPSTPIHVDPGAGAVPYENAVLAPLGMREGVPADLAALAAPGDIVVLAPGDTPPRDAAHVDTVAVTIDEREAFAVSAGTPHTITLVTLWRR